MDKPSVTEKSSKEMLQNKVKQKVRRQKKSVLLDKELLEWLSL
jgi:hypothetical protein